MENRRKPAPPAATLDINCDCKENPVYNPQAEAARANLIEHICAMPPIPTALDALLEHYGTSAVAEVTGRSASGLSAMHTDSSASKADHRAPTLPKPPRS
jgi:hypothetical protein